MVHAADAPPSDRNSDVSEMIVLGEPSQIFEPFWVESLFNTIIPRLTERKDSELKRDTTPGKCVGV